MLKSESSSKKHNLQLTDVFIKVCFFVCVFKGFICLNLLITPQFSLYLRFLYSLRNHVGKNVYQHLFTIWEHY